ncbi:hypothetical protein LB456_10485 [Psychroflexus sp. CAK57W]|uniref:pirin-like C-terminal cupin domain-containing protein n=1 Tax=Psychroflexus curvus TaxID=2873595 RepID=UPI001CCE1943|nr:pirin-like C-terminal cupin domain-containing protein [Psychroflexus curvus]MBZ9628874.1 hypothetical protein [Psychroflexus curvus]MBZ9787882.1 hypothetical protein [Psychroflexus curvus]
MSNVDLIIEERATDIGNFTLKANTTVYIFGGEVFPEKRYIHWNFVSSSKDKIQKARDMWKNQEFDKVPGETDFVPLPG